MAPLQVPHSEQPLSPLPQPQNIPGFRSGREADTQPGDKEDADYKDDEDARSAINDDKDDNSLKERFPS